MTKNKTVATWLALLGGPLGLHRFYLHGLGDNLSRRAQAVGGDHSTLNPSAYAWGQDFNVTLAPAMRFIVDFGQSEPMIGVNSDSRHQSRALSEASRAWSMLPVATSESTRLA